MDKSYLKSVLIRKAIKLSLKSKAQVFLIVKLNRRTTIYSSESDYEAFIEKSLVKNTKINKIFTNKDYEKVKRSEVNQLKKNKLRLDDTDLIEIDESIENQDFTDDLNISKEGT